MERKSIVFYAEWVDLLRSLSDGEFRAVVTAVCGHAELPPDLSPEATMACRFIGAQVQRDGAKYDDVRKRRSEAGKKGMFNRWHGKHNTDNNVTTVITPITNITPVTDNVDVDVNVDENVDNGCTNVPHVSKNLIGLTANTSADAADASAAAKDAKAFLKFFNDAMDAARAVIPRAKDVSGQRLGLLNARIAEYGKRAVGEAIHKAAASRFLNGGGDRAFVADMTWILRPNNFIKILEGNYDNRDNHGNNDKQADKQAKRRGTEAGDIPLADYDQPF